MQLKTSPDDIKFQFTFNFCGVLFRTFNHYLHTFARTLNENHLKTNNNKTHNDFSTVFDSRNDLLITFNVEDVL